MIYDDLHDGILLASDHDTKLPLWVAYPETEAGTADLNEVRRRVESHVGCFVVLHYERSYWDQTIQDYAITPITLLQKEDHAQPADSH